MGGSVEARRRRTGTGPARTVVLPADLDRAIVAEARARRVSIDAIVTDAVARYVDRPFARTG